MYLAFIDEFGCLKPYSKEMLSNPGYSPVRGYGGLLIPSQSLKAFSEDFAVLKILAIREFDRFLRKTTPSTQHLKTLAPKALNRRVSAEVVRKLIKAGPNSDKIRSAIIRNEIKSSDFIRADPDYLSARIRLVQLFLRCAIEHDATIFFSGYEKKTIVLPANLSEENSKTLFELENVTDVLRRIAVKRDCTIKVLLDHHSIDEMKQSPLIRKRRFDDIIQERNLSRWFPETATVGVNSKYSLGMQAADWACGLVSRYLALTVEPKFRRNISDLFPLKVRNDFGRLISPESSLRHGRGKGFTSQLASQAAQLELPL